MATLSSVLGQIRQHESSGNYNLTPQQNVGYPASHASGAYQFQPGTWQSYTLQSGIGRQYAEAYQAPPGVQDAVAAYAATHGPGVNSTALWGGPQGGNYPQITSNDVDPLQLAGGGGLGGGTPTGNPLTSPDFGTSPPGTTLYQFTNPDGTHGLVNDPSFLPPGATNLTPLPPSGSGTAPAGGGTGAGIGGAGAGQPGFLPPAATGGPQAFGLAPGLAQGVGNWITGIEGAVGNAFRAAWAATIGQIENLFVRAALIVAGLVLIAIALWRIVDPGGEKTKQVLSHVPIPV